MARKISAADAMPPSAAPTGTMIRARSRSDPRSSSRLASRPTTRKKNVISPSLTQSRRCRASVWSPSEIDSVVVHSSS
jgi:hypothetical protein